MATFTKRFLSGSTNGKYISVAATATPGTAIHTSVTGTADMDEIFIYAINITTTARKLTLEWGDVAAGANIEYTVPAESGLYLIVPGLLLNNANAVAAFAEAASSIMIYGWVNRITA